MLLIIAFRSEGEKFAYGHICHDESTRVFCGKHIPGPVLDCGIKDPGNPYVGKVTASCLECISEYNNGRREGYAERS